MFGFSSSHQKDFDGKSAFPGYRGILKGTYKAIRLGLCNFSNGQSGRLSRLGSSTLDVKVQALEVDECGGSLAYCAA